MLTIDKIIAKAGGPNALAAEALRQGQNLQAASVNNWRVTGIIPEKRWEVVRALVNVSEKRLHKLNEAARANGRGE